MIVFVHGVPDTPALWEPLIAALGLKPGEWLAPALPGFGRAVPAGFTCTKDAYADWLAVVRPVVSAQLAAGVPA